MSTNLRSAHGSPQLHDRIELEHGLGAGGVTHDRTIGGSTQCRATREYF